MKNVMFHVAIALAFLPACAAHGETQSASECVQLALADTAAPALAPRQDVVRAAPSASTCWIDAADVAAWSGGTPTWVDVRSQVAARGSALAGALRIPLGDLAHKPFLRTQPLVVVGTGYDDVELAQACETLQREGFTRVRLLRGGVRAWHASGRAMTGTSDDLLDSISPAEFHRSVAAAPWAVLGVGVAPGEGLPPRLSALRAIDGGGDVGNAIRAISRTARPSLVVLVAADDANARELRAGVRRAALTDVLTLDGGLAAYRRFLAEQESIAANAGRPLVRPCGTS